MSALWRVYQRSTDDLFDHLLSIRGLEKNQLQPDFSEHLHDPFLLPDMAKAVELISEVKKKKGRVAIFGDYDADGTPAAAVLALTFNRLGLEFEVFLPTRESGYGLKKEVIEKLIGKFSLLITVDTGISSVEEVALAKKSGLKTIIIDHHLPPETLPPAAAIIDPFVKNSKYPFPYLCGCALAYKLVLALAQKHPTELSEGFGKWLLDLVAISTVADMMPMIGENRVLVHFGLQVLKKNRRAGLGALMAKAGLTVEKLNAGSLGFIIGPRLNASGRLNDNRPAYELLITDSLEAAEKLAAEIEKANLERRGLVDATLAQAEKQLFSQNKTGDHLYAVYDPAWPAGVLGLVAGRLAARYHRPVIVGTIINGELRASARSSGDYSIVEALALNEPLLGGYGGHKAAAGLNLALSNWPQLVRSLKAHAKTNIAKDLLRPIYLADAAIDEAELTLETAKLCEQLEPFGLQNSQPLFILKNVELGGPKVIGRDGTHLRWQARFGQAPLEVIGFGFAERAAKELPKTVQLLGYLECNRWQGNERLQLRLVDYSLPEAPVEVMRLPGRAKVREKIR